MTRSLLGNRRVRSALLALVLVVCALLVGVRQVRTGATYGGDSVHYYAHVRSLVIDRDLDLTNELTHLHEERSAHTGNRKLPEPPSISPVTGRAATLFPVGTAVLLTPFFVLGHLVASLVAAGGGPAADGFGAIYSLACGLGVVVYIGLALRLLFRLGGLTEQTPSVAFTGALGIFLGTPWLYYGTLDPLHSHAYAAFTVTLFLWVLLGRALRGSARWWLLLGACGGLMGLVRYQDTALVLLAPTALVWNWRDSLGHPGRTVGRLGALALGVAAVIAIQLAALHYLYGSIFRTGHASLAGQSFEYLSTPHFLYTAISAESGFLRWSPVIALAFVGVGLLFGRRPLVALLCGAAILGQWYVMSAWTDLSQSHSFGNRHFVSASAFLALGLMETIRVIGERWPNLGRDGSRLAFLAIVGGANFVLLILYSLRIIGEPY